MKRITCLMLAVLMALGVTALASNADLSMGITSSQQRPSKQLMPEIINPMTSAIMYNGAKAWYVQEDFELAVFPPTGWTLAGAANLWSRSTLCSGYGTGTASAMANFYGIASGTQDLITITFAATTAADSLKFDHAYATFISENDQLQISTSTDGGSNWSVLITLDGGVSGPLVTAPPQTSSFVPTAGQWASKSYSVPVGTNAVKFTAITAWGNQLYLDNVAIGSSYTPATDDLALQSIDVPAGAYMDPNVAFTPTVTVSNPGTTPVTDFQVIYNIDDGSKAPVYSDTVFVTTADTLQPDSSQQYLFTNFTPLNYTEYDVTAYVSVAGDPNNANDTLGAFFRTWDLDVGTSVILAPTGTVDPESTIVPTATFHNYATQTADFDAYFEIYEGASIVYGESVNITGLAAGADTTITFSTWAAPHNDGNYSAVAYTSMAYDLDAGNDTLAQDFTCGFMGWTALTPAGTYPSQWPGSCTDGDKMYIVGGLYQSGTASNYVQVYDTIAGWSQLTTLPTAVIAPSCAVIGGKLYVIGGLDAGFVGQNLTQIYDIAGNSWSTATAPISARGGCSGGVVGDKMYIVGGLFSSSFPVDCPTYEYDPAADTVGGAPWNAMTACPRGASGMALGAPFNGAPGLTVVYAGGDYRGSVAAYGYYIYDPALDSWTTIAQPPADVGGMGPGLAWTNDHAYLFGGNPAGVWIPPYSAKTYVYDPIGDSWTDAGVSMNSAYEGMGFGILGQKLFSFGGTIGSGPIDPPNFEWTYTSEYTGVEGKPTELAKPAIFALLPNFPNPVSSRTTLSFNLPKAGEYSLKVYNIAGQMVDRIGGRGQAGPNSVSWNASKSGAGVYFYRLSSGGQSATGKLVVVK